MAVRKQRRIERVQQAIASMPIRPTAALMAFEHFCKTGELPEPQRLAWEVCRRAMGDQYIGPYLDAGSFGRLSLLILETTGQAPKIAPSPPQRSVRQHLFTEAVYGEGIRRLAAREVLTVYVRYGADVTDPGFLADKTLPKHSSVGVHLAGFPERLVQRPYVAQARRLLQRFDALRDRIALENRAWFKAFEAAMHSFTHYRELPEDELLREAVLAAAELNALILHDGGEDVSELMAACDKAAKAKGDARAAAYAEVAALADPGAEVKMTKTSSRRLCRVEQAIGRLPVRPEKAFEHFRETGELPEEQRLADAVCRRALNIEEPPKDLAELIGRSMRIEVVQAVPEQSGPSVRENLLHEAVFGDDFHRRAARIALRREVDLGADPTDPSFLADKTFPDHSSIGMHLLGFIERLMKTPYVAQARRLFKRTAQLRDRIDHEDPSWWKALEAALYTFDDNGELPDDELLREAVLAGEELLALFRHYRGHDVRELMGACDKAARLQGAARRAAQVEVAAVRYAKAFMEPGP